MHTFCPVVLPAMPLTCKPVTRALVDCEIWCQLQVITCNYRF